VLEEFKRFLLRGNVIDLAVAVVMGAAFGAVVTAIVEGLITPLIAAIIGQPDFSAIAFTINNSTFSIGRVINALVSFLAIATVIFFVVVKPMNALTARLIRQEAPPPAPPTREEILLAEIRDLLRERGSAGQ
jgi:large conductance mechanosensitive channel